MLRPDGRLNDDFFAHPLRELQDTLRPRVRRRQALDAIDALLPADPLLFGADVLLADGGRRSVHPLLPGLERGQVSLTVTRRDEVAHLDVVVGLAGEYGTDDGTRLAVELPLVQARDDELVAIAGSEDGPLTVELDERLGDDESATVRALVTADGGRLAIGLRGVDIGTGSLDDVEVDTGELGADAVAAIVALLRALLAAVDASDDDALEALVDHLPGALGLDPDASALPLLALASDARAFRTWLSAQVPREGDVPALRSWVTHLLGLLGLEVELPTARPTLAAPWTVPLSTGPPAVELTLAIASRPGDGERTLRTGLRARAGAAGTGADLALDATLADLPLGGEAPAVLLPHAALVVAAPPAGADGPLVDTAEVGIGALRAGLSWDGARLAPLLELDDVRLPGAPAFERLDLSAADTLSTTAHELLRQAIRDAVGETGLARPLLVLAGLDDALDHRVDPVALAMDPLAALRRFHREALDRAEGWTAQLAALGELLGADPDDVAGAGTADDPWAVDVAALSGPELSARLLAWDATPDGPIRGLRIGFALAGSMDSPAWAVEWRGVLVAADLGPSGPADLRLIGEQAMSAHVDVPAAEGSVTADAVALDARWRPGAPLTANATVAGVEVGGTAIGDVELPDAFDPTAPDLGLGLGPERAWDVVRTLLARAASTYGGAPGRATAALLGLDDGGVPELPDDWPALPLPDAGDVRSLLDDAAAVVRERLARLADGADGLGVAGEPYVLAGLRLVRDLLDGDVVPGPEPAAAAAPGDGPAGTGSPDAPWRLALADGQVRALAWLEPDGPPPEWARAAGAALDGDLDAAVSTAARSLPGVTDVLVGRGTDAVRDAVERLAGALDGTDGLVPPGAARPAAWRSGADVTAAHHLLPRAEAATAQLEEEIAARTDGLEPGDWAVLLVGPAFVPAGLWDALLATVARSEPAVVDLDAEPASELADLGTLPAADFYDVRVRDDGDADVERQLARVADRVRQLRPGSRLLLVAHSTAGAPAARYAADHADDMLGVVTLGSPLAAVPAGPLDDPALAEALRTVRALLPLLGVPELDDALGFLHDAVEGFAGAGADEAPRPFTVPASSFTEVPELPELDGTPALAIAGALPAALGDAVERALADALQALPDEPGRRPPTHAAAGVEAALELPGAHGGDLDVEVDGALELGALQLAAAVRAPRLRVRARIVREGGALLDGRDLAARVRWVELAVDAGAGFTVRMHEASLRGVRRAVAGLDDAVGRQLFALLVEELDQLADGSPRLHALLDLLTDDLGLLLRDDRDRLAVAADAAEALHSDAATWLAARLPGLLDREAGFLGLARDPLAVAGRGPWRRALSPLPLELEVRREPWTLAVRTTGDGIDLGADARLAGATEVPTAGGEAKLDGTLDVGALTVARAGGRTTVALEGVLAPAPIDRVLTEALAHLAGSAALTTVVERLVPPRVAEHLRAVPALLRDPGAVLHARLYSGGDPATLSALLAEAGAALGLTVGDDASVELPGGLVVAATGLDGRVHVAVTAPEDGLAVAGAATLRLDAGVAVDGARGVEPTADLAIDADLPGSWDAAALVATLHGDTVRIAVEPPGDDAITLLPTFSGWRPLVGDAADRLLAQALDALAAAVPGSPLRTGALAVARALGVFETSFGDGPVALRELAMETIAERAEAVAADVVALVDRAIGASLPDGATLTADGAAARLEVPGLRDGSLLLAAELDGPAVRAELRDLVTGPARADLALRWAAGATGDLNLDLDVGRALGFALEPRLSIRMGEADELLVALLPLGAGSGDRARIELAPAPGARLTDAGRDELARTWLVPPALQVLLDAAADRLDRPLFADGPTARELLRAAGALEDDGALRIPVPAPLVLLAGLAPELAREPGELELPLGLDGVVLALDGGTAGDRVGAVLRGDVALPVAGLDVHLLFGDGLALELLAREDGEWALRPRLRLERAGAGLAHAGGERLLDTPLVTLGSVDARADTVLELAPGGGGFAPHPWRTELDLREVGLPALTGAAGDNPVASSLLQAAERAEGDTGDAEPSTPPIDLLVGFDAGELELSVAGATSGRPRWFEVERSFGPLHIEQLGVETGEASLPAPGGGSERLDYVGVLLDASVAVGGLAVAADGLALRIPPKYVGSPRHWGLELAGLGLSYRQAGLALEGALTEGPDGEEYRGTLQAQVAERGFAGIGAYGRPSGPLGDDYTSLLAFVVMTAPLGGPPYLYVTALAGGAGYNRRLLVPTEPEGVGAFPLVQALDGDLGATPLDALERLGDAMPPRRGSLWIAAGVRFTTFAVLRTVAVAHAALDRELEVGLLGLTSAALPSAGKEMASLELALAARYREIDRTLAVRAQLTENSWLLSRDCQLTGGFALVVWFAEDRAVLTVGGYHPDFPVPADFPRVPRVGFHWAVSDGIVVKGESYFAITQSAAMAGGRLEVSYDRDPVRVWFRAALDVLVRYKPFWFRADASISVGAAFHYQVCFIKCATINVSVEVGARLRLEGPPLRGRVTVDLAIASVSVPFGPDDPVPTHLSWPEFTREYLVAEAGEAPTRAQVTAGAAVEDAAAEAPDGTEARPLRVLPEFAVATEGAVPCVDARFGARPPQSGDVASGFLVAPTGPGPRLAARHSVSLEVRDGDRWEVVDRPPDRLVVDVVEGGVSEAVFVPAPRSIEDVRPNAPLVPAVTGLRVAARSEVRSGAELPPIPVADIVDDSEPLPLPLTGGEAPEPVARRAGPPAPPPPAPQPAPAAPSRPLLRAVRRAALSARAVRRTAAGRHGDGLPRMRLPAGERAGLRRLAPRASERVAPLRPEAPPATAAPPGPGADAVAPLPPDTVDGERPLVAGETQVWDLPGRRWRVALRGEGAARVVCLNGSGHVLADREGTWGDAAADLPEDTVRLALSGLGDAPRRAMPAPGAVAVARAAAGARPAAGWQAHSRLLQVAPSTLVAPGAVVLLPAPWIGRGPHPTVGADELARALPGVATQLPAAIGVLVVQLDRRTEGAGLEGVAIAAPGLSLTAPERVDTGDRLSLVYGVEDAGRAGERVTVSVAAGSGWTPAGVVGASGDAADWADALRRTPRLALVGDAVPRADAALSVSLVSEEVG